MLKEESGVPTPSSEKIERRTAKKAPVTQSTPCIFYPLFKVAMRDLERNILGPRVVYKVRNSPLKGAR